MKWKKNREKTEFIFLNANSILLVTCIKHFSSFCPHLQSNLNIDFFGKKFCTSGGIVYRTVFSVIWFPNKKNTL